MMFKRVLAAVLVYFLLAAGSLFAQENTAESSDQQINEFTLAGYAEKGKKSWDLAGKTADIFTNTVKLTDVVGNLYGKEEDVNLTAQKGDFNKADGKVHLEKDVVITTTSGTRLTTDSLDWDRRAQLVTTPDVVHITRDNMVTNGTGAVGKMGLKQVTLQKDVTVDILPQKKGEQAPDMKEKVVITCDGPLEVDYEKNIAYFNKNVKVEREDSTIYSDKMDVYFRTAPQKAAAEQEKSADTSTAAEKSLMGSRIDKVVARGNVKVVRGENISYSDEATYSSIDKKLTLSGRPKLILYSTEDLNASSGN